MAEKTLEERVFKATEDMIQRENMASLELLEKGIGDLLDAKRKEITTNLEKGFGMSHDPIAHRSDLIALGRKTALEKADTTKRTPTSETPGGPEGNTPPSPIDELFSKAKKGDLPE